MELTREKEFVNQYHYDARNLEWEKENTNKCCGCPSIHGCP